MATVVGLDIGTKSIKVAVLHGTGKGLVLDDFFVEPIPEMGMGSGVEGRPLAGDYDPEADEPLSVGEVVRKLLADRGLTHADIVATLESRNCVVREMWVPFTREDQISKTLVFEAENTLTTFDVEDMVLDYHKIDEEDGRSQLILFAARHKTVRERLDLLKEGGVDPVSLDLDSAALFNAFALTPTFDPERNTLLVDIGGTTVQVLLIQDGTLKKTRTIRMGALLGEHGAPRLAEPAPAAEIPAAGDATPDMGLPDATSIEARFDEIENALRRLDPLGSGEATGVEEGAASSLLLDLASDDEPIAILTDDEYDRVSSEEELEADTDVETATGEASATDDGERSMATLEQLSDAAHVGAAPSGSGNAPPAIEYSEFLERLGHEIQRTFAVQFVRSPVELIVFTGGKARRDETRRFFSEEFDVETIPLEFGDSFQVAIGQESMEQVNQLGAVAVGLAAKELGKDRLELDFRRGPFRYERRFDKLKHPMLLTGLLLCALFLQTVFDLIYQYQFWGNRTRQIVAKEQAYYETFWGTLASAVNVPNNSFVRATENLQEELDGLIGKNVEIIDDVSTFAQIRAVLAKARRQNIEFQVKGINLNLLTKSVTRSARTSGSRRNQPRLAAAGSSRITLSTSDLEGGHAIAKLFEEESSIWNAEATVSGGRSRTSESERVYNVTLNLTPTDRYLRSLE